MVHSRQVYIPGQHIFSAIGSRMMGGDDIGEWRLKIRYRRCTSGVYIVNKCQRSSWRRSVYLTIYNHVFSVTAQGACNNETEFHCKNDQCIPLALHNNTVNDCGDNSDEGKVNDCIMYNMLRIIQIRCYSCSLEGRFQVELETNLAA